MIISIDHGNKQIKTLNRTFTSGIYESDNKLSVILQLSHYSGLYKKYVSYFLIQRQTISFTFKNTPYSIFIYKGNSYPQAYAGVMTVYVMNGDILCSFVVDIIYGIRGKH